MTTPTLTSESGEYLEQVKEALADLADEERAELLDDVSQHLADIGAEDGGHSLRDRLGDPAAYAEELRTAAGLGSQTLVGDSPLRNPGEVLTAGIQGGRELIADLRPAWWIIRGALLAALPFWLGSNADDNFPVPSPGDNHALGLVFLLIGAGLSAWLGRSADRPSWRRLGIATNVLFFIGLVLTSLSPVAAPTPSQSVQFVPQMPGQLGVLASPHGPVTNIYPYDSQGRPLEGVLLFDQDGRPLRAGSQEWWEDGCTRAPLHPLAADGVPLEFSYPYRYGVTGRSNQAVQQDFMERAMAERTGQDPAATQGCLPEIPRPQVPIPVFPPPATAEGTPPPAEGAPPPAP